MLEFQQDNQFFLFNLTEKPTEPASFFESAFWEKQQRITGSAKGRGTTYFLNTKDLFGVNTALRHYYRGGLWGKFNKDRYRFQSFTETRSMAEFQLLNQLHQAGVAVPKPIAARVKKGKLGICYQADILTEKIENAQDLTALLQGKGKAEHANAVAANVALLLKLFGHDDLKQNVQNVLAHLASGKAFETLQHLTKY